MKKYDLEQRLDEFLNSTTSEKNGSCFLCFAKIKDGATEEHIFPQWFLDEWELRKTGIVQKSGDETIHGEYAKLKIKCCKLCNNNFLSQIETKIKSYILESKEVSISKLIIWLSKIILAINFKAIKKDKWQMSEGQWIQLCNLHMLIYGFRFYPGKMELENNKSIWAIREMKLTEGYSWPIDYHFVTWETSSYLSLRIRNKFIWFVPFVDEEEYKKIVEYGQIIIVSMKRDLDLAIQSSILGFMFAKQFISQLVFWEPKTFNENSHAVFGLKINKVNNYFSNEASFKEEFDNIIQSLYNVKSSVKKTPEEFIKGKIERAQK